MKGKPLEIHFREDAIPQALHTPVAVPYHWKKEVKEGKYQDVCLGIIEPMPTDTPPPDLAEQDGGCLQKGWEP